MHSVLPHNSTFKSGTQCMLTHRQQLSYVILIIVHRGSFFKGFFVLTLPGVFFKYSFFSEIVDLRIFAM